METHTTYCNVCGWIAGGGTCDACGAPPGEVPETRDHENLSLLAGPQPESYPHLRTAFAAWRGQDWPRMVGQCLEVLGVTALTITRRDDGPCWTFVQDSAAVYMHIREDEAVLTLESPIVWMPQTQGVPLMRALLELNAYAMGSSRFCLRGDRVVLRFEDTLANLNPPKLIDAVCEVAVLADDYDDQLSAMFAARMIGPVAQSENLDWSFLGQPRRLTLPDQGFAYSTPAEAPGPPVDRVVMGESSSSSGSRRWGARGPHAPTRVAEPSGDERPRLQDRLEAAEQLCDLLRESQQIGLALSFKEQSEEIHFVMLQRALLFRAQRAFTELCPGAVAQLTSKAGRVLSPLFQGEDGKPHGLMSLGLEDNAELAMPAALAVGEACDALLATGGLSDFGDPDQAEPFRTRIDTVHHFRGAMEALEDGPSDNQYVHFLLVGMLAEILLRASLPDRLADTADRAFRLASERGPDPQQTRQLRELMQGLIR